MKTYILILGPMLLFVISIIAQETAVGQGQGLNLKVKTVQGQQAVIEDQETGTQYTVQVGDQVKGWKIVSITDTLVTIEKETDNLHAIRAQLPVQPLIPSPSPQQP